MKIEEIEKVDYASINVGKIVAKDFRKALVFKSYGLDFCCGGAIKLKDAASENKLNLDEIIVQLEEIDNSTEVDQDYNSWDLPRLIEHINKKHHTYVRNTAEQLQPMLNKVEMVHGGAHPELIEVNRLFKEITAELIPHMMKEENILFPAINEIVNKEDVTGCFGSVQNPINAMSHEHDIAGDLMKEIHRLTDGYTLPKGACATYTVVYKTLKEFEDDLFTHIHLENNILFPKAVELECKI